MEPFIGQVMLFAGNYAPRGWAFCEGQSLAIMDNQALFSILGTSFGGDGRVTFNLPDLRGRVPVGVNGSGSYSSAGDFRSTVKAVASSDENGVDVQGGLAMRYIIALEGIYPF